MSIYIYTTFIFSLKIQEKNLKELFWVKNISEFSRVFRIESFIIDSKHKNKI